MRLPEPRFPTLAGALCLLPLLAACAEPTVLVKGTVRAGIDEESEPFANATIDLLDEGGKKLDTVKTDAQGRFTGELPEGITFHAVIDGDAHVPAAFTGQAGVDDVFKVEEGTLHGISEADLAEWTTAFAGCPGIGEGGAVFGIARTLELVNDDGEHPSVSTGVAELWDEKTDETIPACYLDAETMTYDPDAQFTGETGMFAIFGVPEGTWVLSMGLEVFPDSYTWDDTYVYVPEGGAAPRFPAWVHFPVR